jgi:hypothetical protein
MIKIKKYNIINETEDDIISDIIKICYDINTLDNNTCIFCGENIGNMITSYNISNQYYYPIVNLSDNNIKSLGYLNHFPAYTYLKFDKNFLMVVNRKEEFKNYINNIERNKKLKALKIV